MKTDAVLKYLLGAGAVYAVVAACGSGSGGLMGGDGGHDGMSPVPDAMADLNESGSRLKAQYFNGSDGSKMFSNMYDTKLKVQCTYATASDGTSRCLPTGLGTVSNTNYYSDEHCSQPVLAIPNVCTTPPPYVVTFGTDCTGTTTFHVFPIGSMITPGTTLYVGSGSGATGTCVAFPSKDLKGTIFSAGSELSPSQFVEGTKDSM
jgi:hypothetical protein